MKEPNIRIKDKTINKNAVISVDIAIKISRKKGLKKKLLPKRTIKVQIEKSFVKTQELAAAYVSTRGPGSIIGDEVLDFQVRNGSGYFHFSIATSKVE